MIGIGVGLRSERTVARATMRAMVRPLRHASARTDRHAADPPSPPDLPSDVEPVAPGGDLIELAPALAAALGIRLLDETGDDGTP